MPRAEPTDGIGSASRGYQPPLQRLSTSDLMCSGRHLSMLDVVEADAFSGNASRCAQARWGGVAVCYGLIIVALWAVLRWLYFQEGSLADGQELSCDSVAASRSRTAIHWIVGTAPAWARNFVVLALAIRGCRRVGGLSHENTGLARAILAGGIGEEDGEAEDAGWLSIVGGHSDGRPQCTWVQARDARGLTAQTARWLTGMKLLFWHWSQPMGYLWLLSAYRCLVAQLGATQQDLAAAVAAREVIYLVSTVLALWFCPVFLLVDLRTVWNEADSPLEGGMRIAMYMLTPHTYVALSLANRFRRWAQAFLCLAAVQVLADISSCYALASLIASSLEVDFSAAANSSAISERCLLLPGEPAELESACIALDSETKCEALPEHCVWAGYTSVDTGPLQIGYGLTAFGFLFFFGPLSISSSFQGCVDKERHRLMRLAKGVSGALLLVVWVGIIGVLGWLVGGGNPFCSGVPPFDSSPCSGHGKCYAASQCHCELSWGPESKISGTDLCSCPEGFIGEDCNTCESGFIGEHCTTAFVISGAKNINSNIPNGVDINGEYVKTERVCSGKPVYQKGGADGLVLFSCSASHGEQPCWNVGRSEYATSCRWDSGNYIGNYVCLTSPDDVGCAGKWYERDSSSSDPNPNTPSIAVVAVGGTGCELHPAPCGAHGHCVGRTAGQPREHRTCACDSGWSGALCDHDPCVGVECQARDHNIHSMGVHVCARDRDGLSYTCPCEGSHTCTCTYGWHGARCDVNCTSGACSAFAINGTRDASLSGLYTKTAHTCNGLPTYQLGGSDGYVLYSWGDDPWVVSTSDDAANCVRAGDRGLWSGYTRCPDSPDGAGCVGRWMENGEVNPAVTVTAVNP
jgi:hypothetical protein